MKLNGVSTRKKEIKCFRTHNEINQQNKNKYEKQEGNYPTYPPLAKSETVNEPKVKVID